YVVEGGTRRQISSGIIAAALAHALGAPTEIAESDLERLAEGPPVEVLEGPKGPPFVVVGGRRMAVRGLPLPHPVLGEEAEQFPEGAEVNVAAANVARAYFEAARSGRYQLERFRTSIQRNGLVSTLRKGARRITRRFSQTRR
ncbi:MAG TPA: hypothetical protein VNI78_12485, partial [Vicinamibacterales bacterium]|nr:hypothetical protein [Vicinamibacterales bacterium]